MATTGFVKNTTASKHNGPYSPTTNKNDNHGKEMITSGGVVNNKNDHNFNRSTTDDATNELTSDYTRITMSSIFAGLRKLRQLDLCHNSIGALRPLTFSDLSQLRILRLDHNSLKLSAEDGAALSDFRYIDELRLDGNPIDCACALMPFVRSRYWRVDRPDLDVKVGPRYGLAGVCDSPALFRGRWIGSMTNDDVCTAQGKPSIKVLLYTRHLDG